MESARKRLSDEDDGGEYSSPAVEGEKWSRERRSGK